MAARRPLPPTPAYPPHQFHHHHLPNDYDPYPELSNPYTPSRFDYPQYAPSGPDSRLYNNVQPRTTLRGGTMLHKGFYDLLSMVPSPSPSRMLWNPPPPPAEQVLAGPRYEDLAKDRAQVYLQSPGAGPTGVYRRAKISKDMVSKPTGFVHLVHASDAGQLEELLTRWGPDGMGKLGDPRWANPIKDRIKSQNQARAVNQVVSALKTSADGRPTAQAAPLRVVNGLSSVTSSTLTTAAIENFRSTLPEAVSGLPVGKPGNSTIRWGGGLNTHQEVQEHDNDSAMEPTPAPEPVRKPITPSLATLEKAVAARIYFENLYYPLFHHPPSREQRRLAMEQDMDQMQLSQGQKNFLRDRWRQNETDYLRERRHKVDVSTFMKLKTIGHGAFGVVSLVREQSTGNLFAMKQLRKTDMLRKGQEGHVRAERDILKSASMVTSPGVAEWIVRLHYSFQDRDNLYLVLEYMGGGDLLNLLIERDVFDEDFTRFYVAEMVLAIEACHKHGFIHRDIKPDNFLFDPEGHLKLSDFGLATDLHWAHDTSYYEQQRLHLLRKHGIDLEDGSGFDTRKTKRMDRKEAELLMSGGEGPGGVFTWREKNRRKLAYSVCGTNSYMSPEVIRGLGYTYSCDWWSLGVIMFECLYGFPPFVSNSRHVTRQKILNWKQSLRFPSRPGVSHEGVKLIQQLLCEPEERLGSHLQAKGSETMRRRSAFLAPGSSIDGAAHIKAHPWFKGIDWANIHRYTAPYRPDLETPEDTKHFDTDIPAEPLAPANGAPADATRDPLLRNKVHGAEILDVRKALAFAGFTHKSPRVISYVRADRVFHPEPNTYGQEPAEEPDRGRSVIRESHLVGQGRAMSM
ncbi:kinase-like domain-containing protein [Pterulicium gracile]|uniref:non-specific serine/threonine protein kinase n=1 Tax=Pterulicium gracile TaxID=1884261 RepID=A0A5C3QVV4_9AGAR|nr:kinase-like domain-containing protein [Pterula gracilis]